MTSKPDHPVDNALLSALAPEQRRRFLEGAQRMSLSPGRVLADPEQPIQFVYFPIDAVLSVLSVMTNRIAVETAVVGCEGMTPLAAFHQVDSAPEQVIVQVPGEAWRMPREAFHLALADVPALRALLHRYSQALFTFAAQSSGCNRQHSVVQRCARWLLTTHDRVPGDEFHLTHLFLSQMLGVRRSSVTVAAEVLRAAGAITYTRGKVRITDREELLARSCDCYQIIRSTFDRLLAGRNTPSPLSHMALSDGDISVVGGGAPTDGDSPLDGVPGLSPDASLQEFSGRLRAARQRSEALLALGEASSVSRDEVLRLSEELSFALEQLSVAEEEMRVQVEALTEIRVGLEAQQQLWRARFDGLPDAFIETDQDDRIVELNRAAEDLLGRPRRTVVGKPVTTLFPDTDRRGLREVITQLRRGGRAAHWSGTLLDAARGRPEVQVTVAATPAVTLTGARSIDGRGPSARFLGARWLLRTTRLSSTKRT